MTVTQLQRFSNRHQEYDNEYEPISPTALDTPYNTDPSLYDMVDGRQRNGGYSERPPAVAFHRLPPEVIQRIFWMVDSNLFASLALLNRTWYHQAQRPELYAHHLSRCPSYALCNNVITGPFRKNDLLRLKTKFAAEVRRNLFEAFLRPRRTVINLISINSNSSAAFPGSEAFRFAFSPNGQTLLALSSSRIYVLDASTVSVFVRHELKTQRRALAASITDDGSLLAVLSSKHQANIYGLTENGVKHLQVIVLDNAPRTIALAHEGTVMAAAYEDGVEVFSLASNALTTDRRSVRSEAVDILTFSGDGSMLVGSSLSLDDPTAVVINAPFYTENDPDLSPREIHSRMWTTQILFPQISSVCSHAALIPGHNEGDANWLFAFDHSLMSYRAVRTDDTRFGVAYFLSPPALRRFSFPVPSTAPATSACGSMVVAGFAQSGLWLYGMPERLDVSPDMGAVVERHEARMRGPAALTTATGNIEPLMAYSPSVSGSSEEIDEDSLAQKVDWRQSLFVKCRYVKSLEGVNDAKWVERSESNPCEFPGRRLLAVAPGGVSGFGEELGEENMPVDGSRLCVVDFDYAPSAGVDREITIEVGDKPPLVLTEYAGNLDTEVAMERRRTVRHAVRGAARAPIGRSITAAAASIANGSVYDGLDAVRRGSASSPSSPVEGLGARIGYGETLLRQHDLIQRSASVAGFRSARYPPRAPLGNNYAEAGHNRPNDRRRTSEDSWETPPPSYPSALQTTGHFTPPRQTDRVSLAGFDHNAFNNQRPSPISPQPLSIPEGLETIQDMPEVQQNQQNLNFGHPSRHWTEPAERISPPVHVPNRASTTLVGATRPDAAPSRRHMNPYSALAGMVHSRGINDSPMDTPPDQPQHHQVSRSTQLPSSAISPVSSESSYFVARRPMSQGGMIRSPTGELNMKATVTHPLTPPTPERMLSVLDQQTSPSPLNTPSSAGGGITLSGANLQNRLNHPVPPIPNEEQQRSISMPEQAYRQPQPSSSANESTPPRVNGPIPPILAPPTPDQMARLNRRSMQQIQTSIPPSNYVAQTNTRDFGPAPSSSPRGAWGAAGVPGSPSFNKAHNSPTGFGRPNSSSNQNPIPQSFSTPDLLQRPRYGRLDTIDSVTSEFRPSDHEPRAHSFSAQPPIREEPLYAREAYRHDMVQTTPTSKKKKGKKKDRDQQRSESSLGYREEKKKSRCVVM